MMLPEAFVTRLRALLGSAEASALCVALTEGDTPVSVRRNPAKWAADELPFVADDAPLAASPVPWCEEGRYLRRDPPSPSIRVGMPALIMCRKPRRCSWRRPIVRRFPKAAPQRALDLCAAPGGKSTLWRALLPDAHCSWPTNR